jgi:UDP-N-acetylmuramate--alanine ligase
VAQDLNIPIIKRAELLSEIANASQSVTVAGTNGKSTVTGMIGWILSDQRFNPTILNGGGMLNFNRQNAVIGQSDHMVLETDESDGSVTNFHPKIAVLTNISDDHKDMKELEHIFGQYLMQSEKQVLNIDCPHVRQLSTQYPNAKTYTMENIPVDLNLIVPGKHNISNALAAIEVAGFLGVNKKNAVQSLNKFKGVTSRLEVVGRTPNGITIIDDFAHNPDKIIASLKTLKENDKRLHLVYQPQGFGPLKHQKDDLINIFSNYLNKNEFFYMLEAFYAGGTADKSVSSQEIVSEVSKKIPKTSFYSKKEDVFDDLIKNALSGDLICIMGARDDGLRNLAKKIYKELI